MFDRQSAAAASGRLIENPHKPVVGRRRTGNEYARRSGRVPERDTIAGGIACAGEALHEAIRDRQTAARIENDAVRAKAGALDRETSQHDGIGRRRIHGDRIAADRRQRAGDADAFIDDVDRFRDDERAVSGGIEHIDLAAGAGLVVGELKGAARRGDRTAAGSVATLS